MSEIPIQKRAPENITLDVFLMEYTPAQQKAFREAGVVSVAEAQGLLKIPEFARDLKKTADVETALNKQTPKVLEEHEEVVRVEREKMERNTKLGNALNLANVINEQSASGKLSNEKIATFADGVGKACNDLGVSCSMEVYVATSDNAQARKEIATVDLVTGRVDLAASKTNRMTSDTTTEAVHDSADVIALANELLRSFTTKTEIDYKFAAKDPVKLFAVINLALGQDEAGQIPVSRRALDALAQIYNREAAAVPREFWDPKTGVAKRWAEANRVVLTSGANIDIAKLTPPTTNTDTLSA